MHILIDVSDKEVPRKQDIINISLHFINGEVCECNYPYMVLPKGHGRLIDADSMKTMKNIQSANFNAVELIRLWIDNQPTIIEADKEQEE